MDDSNRFDETLIAAYRQQAAPVTMQRKLLEQFEAASQRNNNSWRIPALAVSAIFAVAVVLQANLQSPSPNVLPTQLSLSLSTASFDPLPTLSSIKLGTKPEEASLLNLQSRNLPGRYRKTIRLTTDIL